MSVAELVRLTEVRQYMADHGIDGACNGCRLNQITCDSADTLQNKGCLEFAPIEPKDIPELPKPKSKVGETFKRHHGKGPFEREEKREPHIIPLGGELGRSLIGSRLPSDSYRDSLEVYRLMDLPIGTTHWKPVYPPVERVYVPRYLSALSIDKENKSTCCGKRVLTFAFADGAVTWRVCMKCRLIQEDTE